MTSHPQEPGVARTRGPRSRPALLRSAGYLLYAEVLAILGFSVFFLVELALGEGDDAARVVMSVMLFLLGAFGLVLLARGLLRGHDWPRTPTMLWHVLLLPIGWSMLQAHQIVVGAVLLAAGAAGALVVVVPAARSGQS